MSVSVPFLTWSLHCGTKHTPLLHTPLMQSPPNEHVMPSAHFFPSLMHEPPQSIPVSVPFFFMSMQLGA
jgi:hypothetical protein